MGELEQALGQPRRLAQAEFEHAFERQAKLNRCFAEHRRATCTSRKAPSIERLCTDGAYGGQCAKAIEQTHKIRVEVVRRPGNRSTGTLRDPQQSLWQEPVRGFVVLPKRWVVERTHAWNERWRRLVRHHDHKTSISTA